MNIVVLAKQVPDPEALIEIAGQGQKLEIEQKFAANLFDELALEEALRIKEKHGGKVKVITLGSDKATEVLRTGIAMGADEVLLLEDQALTDGDGFSTAFILSEAIKKEAADIILCGRQAIDDDRAEVGPMVAQFLGLPHVGSVTKLDVSGDKATAEYAIEGGKEVVEVPLPSVFTAERGLNEPRVPMITGVMKAMKTPIPKLKPEELGLSPEQTGAAGAKTKTVQYIPPKKRPGVQFISGEPREAAAEAVRILTDVERVV
ncbi:MAG: Electron transfer flavoprotein subunit beta [Syntrophorhabdaceae bacterium PtaU1.Bin034]|jgi:electron transfer flavoprotein beta subunit|nr:MAG: Electron transfer flavoprotein subunit beta [Syntrophorhabdaceae bacterium PtaU1.Bin034]